MGKLKTVHIALLFLLLSIHESSAETLSSFIPGRRAEKGKEILSPGSNAAIIAGPNGVSEILFNWWRSASVVSANPVSPYKFDKKYSFSWSSSASYFSSFQESTPKSRIKVEYMQFAEEPKWFFARFSQAEGGCFQTGVKISIWGFPAGAVWPAAPVERHVSLGREDITKKISSSAPEANYLVFFNKFGNQKGNLFAVFNPADTKGFTPSQSGGGIEFIPSDKSKEFIVALGYSWSESAEETISNLGSGTADKLLEFMKKIEWHAQLNPAEFDELTSTIKDLLSGFPSGTEKDIDLKGLTEASENDDDILAEGRKELLSADKNSKMKAILKNPVPYFNLQCNIYRKAMEGKDYEKAADALAKLRDFAEALAAQELEALN
ncbi:MAG: hypothetical protein A2X49_07485 [Lentisphaerae bacterium GWF2_52_8]|nr:MAG: hypothetical protein A2X49_07485 [Lentisphaerae bacterium GWF2_52_8]